MNPHIKWANPISREMRRNATFIYYVYNVDYKRMFKD